MSNGSSKNPRRGNQNQQRRRRGSSGGGGGDRGRPQMPKGPMMTALGESTYEAVFDHGGEGYGVWFDGVVRDDPMYKQFWKGTGLRPIFVRIDEDRIVITKELDRDLPGLLRDSSEDTANGNGRSGNEDGDNDSDDEGVYTQEEAAALLTGDSGSGGDSDEDEQEDDAPQAAAEEPAEKPAPKRRAPRRRVVKTDDDE